MIQRFPLTLVRACMRFPMELCVRYSAKYDAPTLHFARVSQFRGAAALALVLAIAPCYAASPWLADDPSAMLRSIEDSAQRNRQRYSDEQDRLWRAEAVERQRQRDDERRRSEDDWQRQQDSLPRRMR